MEDHERRMREYQQRQIEIQENIARKQKEMEA